MNELLKLDHFQDKAVFWLKSKFLKKRQNVDEKKRKKTEKVYM